MTTQESIETMLGFKLFPAQIALLEAIKSGDTVYFARSGGKTVLLKAYVELLRQKHDC